MCEYMKYILWNILWWLHSMSYLALYNCTKQVDLQWSFRAEHRTMLGNLVPMIDDEIKSTMKHLWLPMPPLCGRMYASMHSIPAVTKIALMGIVPSLNVGGIWMPVHWRHCLLNIRSDCDRRLEMQPEYTFSLKSPSRTISESVCFHTINWAINCSKNIVQAERKLPRASKYLLCCFLTVVPAELVDLEPEGWYAMTILVLLLPEPTFSQHQRPRPKGLTPDSTTSAEKLPISMIAHPPCCLPCIRLFILWETTLQVSMPMPIIFLNCCSLVAWRQSAWVLHPAKMLVLNCWQSLLKLLILMSLVKIPKLCKHNCLAFPKVPSHMQARRRSLLSVEILDYGHALWLLWANQSMTIRTAARVRTAPTMLTAN